MCVRTILLLSLLLALLPAAKARVVINEIFYNAPGEIEDLEYIELHNSSDEEVDISGWSFTKGIKYKFPADTIIDAKGFVLLCRNRQRFKQYYGAEVVGVFDSKLSNNGERLELADARGRLVDTVKYQDSAPWPLGADGLSGSLERICPDAGGDNPANWASSPLAEDRAKPAGTPGKVNSSYSAQLPPVISSVKLTPEDPAPNQPLTVEAVVRDPQGVSEVKLLYRLAGAAFEKPEVSLLMKKISDDRYSVEIPGQAANQLVRYRIEAANTNGARRIFPCETEPRPALSAYVHEPITPAKIPFGWMIHTTEAEAGTSLRRPARRALPFLEMLLGGDRAGANSGGRGNRTSSSRSAFVYFDPRTGKLEVFDFVGIEPRSGGFKVHFGKGQMLQQMTTINLIFEQTERFVLAEPLAYEVYRRAGNAVPQSYHVRLWLNGQPLGYHLLVEQPNRAFLRRNKIDDDGNLYKILWYERGVIGQHEKKTHVREGHDDLVALIDALEKTKGDAQWELIKRHFDVEQVINYFAVNMVISHWDGFFNNYFTYHDVNGTGKWTMYPWDQDKTWGFHDGLRAGEVFYTMPITFGMEGDVPPEDRDRDRGFGFGPRGPAWWRPGGYFSRPLLANPQFRKLFLARTKEILEKIYTEEAFVPLIDAMGERLKPEVEVRAGLMNTDPQRALRNMERSLQSLREHLKKRREFLLGQEAIRTAGSFSTAEIDPPAAKK